MPDEPQQKSPPTSRRTLLERQQIRISDRRRSKRPSSQQSSLVSDTSRSVHIIQKDNIPPRQRRPTLRNEPLPDIPPTSAGVKARLSRVIDGLAAFKLFCHLTMRPQRGDDSLWRKALVDVNSAVFDLELRLSLKLHLLSAHTEDFLTKHAAGLSFCAYTEQSFEAFHRHFGVYLTNNNVPLEFKRLSPDAVRRAVVQWAGTRFAAIQYFNLQSRDAR